MSEITEYACQQLAERWKAEFGGGLSPKKVRSAWARRLRKIFDNMEEVTRYYNWFADPVSGWTNNYKPSFQQFVQYCRANKDYHRTQKPDIDVACDHCGGCGSITVPAPLDDRGHVTWDPPGFGYNEPWPHSRVYAFALPCRCAAGSAASDGVFQDTPREAYKLRSRWVDYLRAQEVDSPGYAERLAREYQQDSWQAYMDESAQERTEDSTQECRERMAKRRRQIHKDQENSDSDLAEARDVPEDQIPF